MTTDRLGLNWPIAFDSEDWEVPLNENIGMVDSKLAKEHPGNPNGEVKPDFIGQHIWDSVGRRRWVAHGTNDNQWEIEDFDPGTRMVFLQGSAPVGWVQVISIDDRFLRLVSGNSLSTGGQWTITGLSVDGHKLSISEIPNHNHGGGNHGHNFDVSTDSDGSAKGSTRNWLASDSSSAELKSGGSRSNAGTLRDSVRNSGTVIESDGGNGSHGHGINQNGNWRPSYKNVIVAEKK